MHKAKTYQLLIAGLLLAMIMISSPPGSPSAAALEKSEMRCGWFSNPTPANASLFDREGEWIISVQGGYEAEGDWPQFSDDQWVATNGNYGYGCACLRARVNRSRRKVIAIESAQARALSACRRDPALGNSGLNSQFVRHDRF